MADILIAGAGLGGLTAALALLRKGHRVRVFEQATELRELGAGVQLGANGTRILIALGLEAAMRGIVCEAVAKEIRLGSTGQSWPVFDLGETSVSRFGAPYWMAHRGDFHGVLLQAVRTVDPNAIRTGAGCVGFSESGSDVSLHLVTGESISGDVLIGADGVHSRIRQQMFGQGAAHFTGIMAWRGLVPMARLPAHQRRLVGANWLGVGGHVVTYPLRRGEILNFVGVVERDDWTIESWNEPGSRDECLRDLANWHEDVKTIIRNIDTPFKWALLGRDPLPRFAEDRVCVMGDAAHPTLPFLAQGANMALEDAAVLARCLDDPDIPAALRRYEAARLERTARIVRGSSDNAKRFHNPTLGIPDRAARYVEQEFTPEKISQRYDWLYEYDALTVPLPG
ncbi:MAG TPA: FAD-dependent monooxygenase [Rhodopila sp.]|uniref:FAD-dependent monooxygenase n=1 Tax=Rhodopila sp. TaxID=2480087 RepID=UPI002C54EF54|nr:FAD-dependent monooxygenase [Rhodopila sp.]HVY15832.1 FAD-dependent monooxygenase [Rhodopila sp.]